MLAFNPLDVLTLRPLSMLRGVGPVLEKKLSKLNLHSIFDLLLHFPVRYEDRTKLIPIAHLRPDLLSLVCGTIISLTVLPRKPSQLLLCLKDSTGIIKIRFFRFSTAMKTHFEKAIGQKMICYGMVRQLGHELEMTHPECRFLKNEHSIEEKTFTPIYPSTEGIHQSLLRKIVKQALDLCPKNFQCLLDAPFFIQNSSFLKPSFNFIHSLNAIHYPPLDTPLHELMEGKHPAKQRLALEELLAHHLSLRLSKNYFQTQKSFIFKYDAHAYSQFEKGLPFTLTQAQQRVIKEISDDLSSPVPMLRLIQGDVGSGKTVIAAFATLLGVINGYQVAIMAPTDLLAQQHLENFTHWFKKFSKTAKANIKVLLLSGRLPSKKQKEVQEQMQLGQVDIVIGTHALFQNCTAFKNLGLIVIDEQHRFGVGQRLSLLEKGSSVDYVPHQLIMTATPIPRTLAMTLFADLSYSVLDELPQGRKPIVTVAVNNTRRAEVIERIRLACQKGHQVYWVCLAIADSEMTELHAAEKIVQELMRALPELNIGFIHGKMKNPVKEKAMSDFKKNKMHVLVATTVIEVGVDVPHATLMIIENAERLGLAQLHQLRGRVGRGSEQSYCVLLYQPPLTSIAQERLNVMRESMDGFVIAEKDLKLRGPGEIFGTRQTGLLEFKIADLLRDQILLRDIPKLAECILQQGEQNARLLIKRWLSENYTFKSV